MNLPNERDSRSGTQASTNDVGNKDNNPKWYKGKPGASRKITSRIGHRIEFGEGTVTFKNKSTSEIRRAIVLGLVNTLGVIHFEPPRNLLAKDYHTVQTVYFPRSGGYRTPKHSLENFYLRIYASTAFAYFRSKFYNVQTIDFLNSLCFGELKELANPGASGSIFYQSHDKSLIIKTVQRTECSLLIEMMPEFFMNITQNPHSLLPRFYGLYCYKSHTARIRFVVMKNLLPTNMDIHENYDLKGSTYKRRASRHELEKRCPTLKDLDFVKHHPNGLFLAESHFENLKASIDSDCRVLEASNIMDYSLLLGIHYPEKTGDEENYDALDCTNLNDWNFGGIPATTADGYDARLFVGLIDILQTYQLNKRIEFQIKSLKTDARTISVNPPEKYSVRFKDFLFQTVFHRKN